MAWSTDPDRYRGAPPALSARIRKRDNNTCQACGAFGYQVDHIVNTKAGGTDAPENLQVLCKPCHDAKTTHEGREANRARYRALRLPAEPHPGASRTTHPLATPSSSFPWERRDA